MSKQFTVEEARQFRIDTEFAIANLLEDLQSKLNVPIKSVNVRIKETTRQTTQMFTVEIEAKL